LKRDLTGWTVADVTEALERGRIGHGDAMEYFEIDSYPRLVEIMHLNGRKMPGHREMRISPETMAVLKAALRPERRRRA
jgi:hypothetical protein